MDDFIDDGPEEGDYSKYIKEIFGYDKSKYKNIEEDVDNMESNFAQQMKEEFISKKIGKYFTPSNMRDDLFFNRHLFRAGLMEDLEDMRLEAEEKKRKKRRKVDDYDDD